MPNSIGEPLNRIFDRHPEAFRRFASCLLQLRKIDLQQGQISTDLPSIRLPHVEQSHLNDKTEPQHSKITPKTVPIGNKNSSKKPII
jgi:hypothetical protein